METKIIQDKIEQLEKEINELKQQLLNIPIDDTVNVNTLYKKTNNKLVLCKELSPVSARATLQ